MSSTKTFIFHNSNIGSELIILRYKEFYKKHLLHLKNRETVLKLLQNIIEEFRTTTPNYGIIINPKNIDVERKVSRLLKIYFLPEVTEIYNKDLPKAKPTKQYKSNNTSAFMEFVVSLAEGFDQMNQQNKLEWTYKRNFLIFLHDSISCSGLHSNIYKRDPAQKRFNVLVEHFHKSKISQTECRTQLTYEQLEKEFLVPYKNRKAILFKGKLVPFRSIYETKITSTLLKDDEIYLFAVANNFKWSSTEKNYFAFANKCIDETETYLQNPFNEGSLTSPQNIEETKHWLIAYSSAYKLFCEAFDKFDKHNYQRNVLDDLRLSLEVLLKELLGNQKSLENQLQEVGNFQKKRGASPDTTNMFQKLIEYYSKYQNNYVKHNDKVNKQEIEFVIDLTTAFMKYLLKK